MAHITSHPLAATSRLSNNQLHLYRSCFKLYAFIILSRERNSHPRTTFKLKREKENDVIRELWKTFKKAKRKSLRNSVNNFILHLILLPLLWQDLHQSFTALQFHCKTLAGAISEILGWFWEKLHIWILPSSCSGPYRNACMCLLQKNSCIFRFCSLSVCWGCHASWKDLWTIWVPQEREGTPTLKCYFPSLTLSNLVKKKRCNSMQWFRATSTSPQAHNHGTGWVAKCSRYCFALHTPWKAHTAMGWLKMKSSNLPWAWQSIANNYQSWACEFVVWVSCPQEI